MMAGLFLLFGICIALIWYGHYKLPFALACITLILCAFMLIYHATSVLGIRY